MKDITQIVCDSILWGLYIAVFCILLMFIFGCKEFSGSFPKGLLSEMETSTTTFKPERIK